ncbi:hypothetical protein DRQ16_03640 [bacterium]|nr:MAG: hypothetical protein DRQ16_03640 [bacterium]
MIIRVFNHLTSHPVFFLEGALCYFLRRLYGEQGQDAEAFHGLIKGKFLRKHTHIDFILTKDKKSTRDNGGK